MWHMRVLGGEQDGVAIDMAKGAYCLGSDQTQADIVLSHTDVKAAHLSFQVNQQKMTVVPATGAMCTMNGKPVQSKGRVLTGKSVLQLSQTISLELTPPEMPVKVVTVQAKSKALWILLPILTLVPLKFSPLFVSQNAEAFVTASSPAVAAAPVVAPQLTAPLPLSTESQPTTSVQDEPQLPQPIAPSVKQQASQANRFQLQGIVMQGRGINNRGRGIVLLSVDGSTAKPYQVGAEIDTKLKLVAITPLTASLGDTDGKVALVLVLPKQQ